VKHAPDGGAVEVDLRPGAGHTTLTVRDNGPGVPDEHASQLFTRFFRGDPARPRPGGTGLGLAIAKAGAEAHGGTLQYLGDARGAVFRLTLP
jgi:signal transduction histidine kinase